MKSPKHCHFYYLLSFVCLYFFLYLFKQTPLIIKEKGKSKKNKLDENLKNDDWVVFCDFHEITHTVIREAMVTIYRQDNKKMVRQNLKALCPMVKLPLYEKCCTLASKINPSLFFNNKCLLYTIIQFEINVLYTVDGSFLLQWPQTYTSQQILL